MLNEENIMKKRVKAIFLIGIVIIFAMTSQLDAFSGEEEVITLKGDIIDNMCANANKNNLGEFVKTHTKECALMTHCVASGYAIYADGRLQVFDEESNKKVEEFLRKSSSKLQVQVTAKKAGDELSLISIENQK